MAPVVDGDGRARGVVAEGPVGSRCLGVSRLFRYEVRRWPDGAIPDVAEAVKSPQRVAREPFLAQRVFDLVPDVPRPVWGRDAFGVHDMWNSNSLISWLLTSAGCDLTRVSLPANGRAPGWRAGVAAATTAARVSANPAEQPKGWGLTPQGQTPEVCFSAGGSGGGRSLRQPARLRRCPRRLPRPRR
jgi:hypothetical protein